MKAQILQIDWRIQNIEERKHIELLVLMMKGMGNAAEAKRAKAAANIARNLVKLLASFDSKMTPKKAA